MSRLVLNLRKTSQKIRLGGAVSVDLSDIDFRATIDGMVEEFSGELHAEEEDRPRIEAEDIEMDGTIFIEDDQYHDQEGGGSGAEVVP